MGGNTAKNAVIIGIVFLIGVCGTLVVKSFSSSPAPVQQSQPVINYRDVVCDNGWESETDLSKTEDEHFTVQLTEGCFSGFVSLPHAWSSWSYQHAPGGNPPGAWVAFKYERMSSTGPMPIDDDGRTAKWYTTKKVRLQGKGAIIFFRK